MWLVGGEGGSRGLGSGKCLLWGWGLDEAEDLSLSVARDAWPCKL